MDLVIKAVNFAGMKHNGQVRKGSGLPYVLHPVIVSLLVAKYKDSKDLESLQAACILHDCLEDTDTNFVELATEFTPLIASLVLELTSDKKEIERIGKNEYMKKHMAGMSKYAFLIKLADRLSNVMDQPKKKYLEDTLELMGYLYEERKLTNTHKEIMKKIVETCKKGLKKK